MVTLLTLPVCYYIRTVDLSLDESNFSIKGTVQRDFSTPVFFLTKRLVLVSIDMPKSDFEFCQIFVELFGLKISKYSLPAVTDSRESKNQP
jgi:hypothetical protein